MTLQEAIQKSAEHHSAFRRKAWLQSHDLTVFRANVDGHEEGFRIIGILWRSPAANWRDGAINLLHVECIMADDWELVAS